jgi:hypothetical protein
VEFATLATNNKELAAVATLAAHDEELAATLANNDEEFAAATALAATKNNCAKSKKIAVEVYRVKAEIKEFNVEQQEAGATALTGPQNTKNNVEVDIAKKTQVEKAAKTTLTTNT